MIARRKPKKPFRMLCSKEETPYFSSPLLCCDKFRDLCIQARDDPESLPVRKVKVTWQDVR